MSDIEYLTRWMELSDGTLSCRTTLYEAMRFNQSYEPFGGSSVQRMMNGAAAKQTNWQRLRTTMSGSGGIPLGLVDLDYSKPLLLKCGVPRMIVRPAAGFNINVGIPLPAARRTDGLYAPEYMQLIGGLWNKIVGGVVSGSATRIGVVYYPQFNCFAEPPKETYSWDEGLPSSWTLEAEEI